jgi:SEC-C motif-containing protein
MGRNEPCWCMSGKKWKNCHRDRNTQTPTNVYATIEAMRSEFAKGYCSHPEAGPSQCSDRVIRAHTVQKSGGLTAIAQAGHVLSPKAAFERLVANDGRVIPEEVGINKASTFPGFCEKHDAEMFRSVEYGTVSLTPETAFLLSFRAIAYEEFQKRAALRIIEVQRDMDKGRQFFDQCEIQEYLHITAVGIKRGLHDLQEWKREYDRAFVDARFASYRFTAVAFDGILPVVACGAFHPEFDFDGRPLQSIGRGDGPFEHVTYNLTAINERSVAVIGWTHGETGPAEMFARSFSSIRASEKANAAIRLAFEHLENTYMRPSWWNGLATATQEAIRNHIVTGLGISVPDRTAASLRDDGVCYSSADAEREISSWLKD